MVSGRCHTLSGMCQSVTGKCHVVSRDDDKKKLGGCQEGVWKVILVDSLGH